jgi:hypothetical protein
MRASLLLSTPPGLPRKKRKINSLSIIIKRIKRIERVTCPTYLLSMLL